MPGIRNAETLSGKRFVEWHPNMPSDPSIWEEGYNPLPINSRHLGRVDVIVAPSPRIYARVQPAAQGTAPEPTGGLFPNSVNCLPILGNVGRMTGGRTRDGHTVFESVGENRTTKSITRWYKDTGEIWALSAWGFYQHGEHPHLACEEMVKDLISWLPLALRTSQAANGKGPFRVQLGAVGLLRVTWWPSRPSPGSNAFFGLNDCVSFEGELTEDSREAVIDLVSGFVRQLTDTFGVSVLDSSQILQWAEKV